MSAALKCDRCGTLYEYDYQLYLCSYYVCKDCHPSGDLKLDLCPNCQQKLIEWVDDGERKETNE